MLMKVKMKVVLPFAVPSAKKGKERKEKGKRKMITKFKKKKIRITQNDPKMTERMTRIYNIP